MIMRERKKREKGKRGSTRERKKKSERTFIRVRGGYCVELQESEWVGFLDGILKEIRWQN